MKTLLTAAALATVALTGAASAQNASPVAEATIARYAPTADLHGLSDVQIQSLLNVIHSGNSRSDAQSTVNALIRNYR